MSAGKLKIIDPKSEQVKHTHLDNWEVMKPFVHFSIKALSIIGMGLVAIIKALPLLRQHSSNNSAVKRK